MCEYQVLGCRQLTRCMLLPTARLVYSSQCHSGCNSTALWRCVPCSLHQRQSVPACCTSVMQVLAACNCSNPIRLWPARLACCAAISTGTVTLSVTMCAHVSSLQVEARGAAACNFPRILLPTSESVLQGLLREPHFHSRDASPWTANLHVKAKPPRPYGTTLHTTFHQLEAPGWMTAPSWSSRQPVTYAAVATPDALLSVCAFCK